ncbi:uncharacterized protein LOC118490499 [Helianthus annuus]|uniref:uncharacterized protein LOC118490499 n=1 Tax=Helianthus annuus TaxID=4232 RepID=UPI001652C9EF|nr:uncharacterized protein LOC118490499 [Helianthus annuus]
MSKFLEQKPSDVFVILQFGRYSFHEGKAYVSSSFQHSNIYLNESIDELIDFQKRLLERRPDVGSSSRPFGSSQAGKTVHDDFLVGTDFKTIDQVNKIQETMNVIVLGTVISFPPGVEWYYNSCKDYMKKVSVLYFISDGEDGLDLSEKKQTIRCINDVYNEKGVSVVPRLKLQLRLQDSTGIASLTCLDHGETDNLLPDEISNFVGKKMAFKVEISHFNVKNHYKSFTVKRFSDDPEIISQLKSKIGIDHVDLSNTMNLSSGDCASVDTVNLKDDSPMSLIGSSVGSISLATKNAEKISEHSELKRNLAESYDHDESATEAALGCNEGFNTYSKEKRKTRKHTANQKDSIPLNNVYETPVSLIDSSAGGMALRNKRLGKMKAQPELKRVLAEDYDRDDSGSLNNCTNTTPFSNITPISINPPILNTNSTNIESHHRRKLQKLYLDTRKAKNKENVIKENRLCLNNSMDNFNSQQRRNLRKTILDKRRSNESDTKKDEFVGVSKDYVDHLDQNVTCQICQAKLWDVEARRGSTKIQFSSSYSICCAYGKVQLLNMNEAPPSYQSLFNGLDSKSKSFIKNIRRYNSMFSFTSIGGKVDKSINRGNAPYISRLGGQNYHRMGSLLLEDGSKPKFSQFYIYDTDNELSNRQSAFGASSTKSLDLDLQVIQHIQNMLDSENVLVKTYRMVRDFFKDNCNAKLKLRLIGIRQQDGRTYNLPTASEVAALIVGDIGDSLENRDIIVETKSGGLQRISELHPSYLALQYPLLFPYGDDCYRIDVPHRGVTPSTSTKRTYVTMREFFAYRIQDRHGVFSLILNSRHLFQQFLVDAYTMIETERLNYIRFQQKVLRCDTFENLSNLRNHGNINVSNTGKRVILPSSFTGGARYMMQNYLDAMSLCKWYGYPNVFITVTCNPKWPEIKRYLKDTNLSPEDRPDILSRLFKIKLNALIKDLKDNSIFGKVSAIVYTVEFQKRGLPHAHICLFMHPDHKFPTVEHIDPLISAEIPD